MFRARIEPAIRTAAVDCSATVPNMRQNILRSLTQEKKYVSLTLAFVMKLLNSRSKFLPDFEKRGVMGKQCFL